jgi:RNA polymerase sigma-70 factor (TIGR02960 family)
MLIHSFLLSDLLHRAGGLSGPLQVQTPDFRRISWRCDRLNFDPAGVSTVVSVSTARGAHRAKDGGVRWELVDRARSGDDVAFEELVHPYHRELQAHCYRILGSAADAEDAFQESLTAAWKGLAGFEGRASFRTWLYRIATGRALNMVRASGRSAVRATLTDAQPSEPSRLGEVLWLEPYPDAILAEVADPTAGPEARYEQRETISLAFIAALQLLPPRQRAALILTDVLEFSAREVADMLETTEQAVYGAVKRARATLARQLPKAEPPPLPNSPDEKKVLDRLVHAWEECDTNALVALLTDDAWLRMPPDPLEYQGKAAKRWFATIAFREGRRFRLIPTRANGQPAFGVYLFSPISRAAHPFALIVVTLAGDRVSTITAFESAVMARFALPRSVARE